MPLVPQEYGDPSTLADVLAQVRDAFSAVADPTPIMIGKQYVTEFGVGSAPRVLFLPETEGRVGPPSKTGYVASITHGCQVFVRAEESGDDVARFDGAYRLSKRVLGFLAVAGSGRLEWGSFGDSSPLDVDGLGAEVSFGFRYRHDVPHDRERWLLAAAATDSTPARPIVPPRLSPDQAGNLSIVVDASELTTLDVAVEVNTEED